MFKSFLKPFIFSFIFIIISSISFLIIGKSFNNIKLNLANWINIIVSVGIFAVAFSLLALNNFKSNKWNLLVIGITAIVVLVVAPVKNLYIFITAAILTIFLFLGEKKIKNILLSSFKLNFYEAISEGSKLVFEGLIILIIIFYYFSPAGEVFQKEFVLPRPFYDKIFKSIAISFLENKKEQIFGGVGQNDFLALKESQQLLKEIADQTYLSLNEGLQTLTKPYKKYIPLILAFSFYLVIKFVAVFIRQISNFLSWLIVKLMFAFGIMRKKKIIVEREFYE